LTSSNISRARFDKASLAGVDLTGAYLLLTRIEGADLSGTTGLIQAQVDLACGNGDTKLPAGLTAPAAWPCED
jgi:uncharacterized protein YjbI with pentapeptide repeats